MISWSSFRITEAPGPVTYHGKLGQSLNIAKSNASSIYKLKALYKSRLLWILIINLITLSLK